MGLQVYITCSVILCMANTTGTRCSQGCIREGNRRGRREAVDQTSRHSISQGPLNLVVPSDNKGYVADPHFSLTEIRKVLMLVDWFCRGDTQCEASG